MVSIIRILKAMFVVVLLLSLTGCVTVRVNMVLNGDGSGDTQYRMLFNPSFIALADGTNGAGSSAIASMVAESEKSGFKTIRITEKGMTGIEASKHFDTVGEMLKESPFRETPNDQPLRFKGPGIGIRKGFLKTRYTLDTDLDLTGMATTGDETQRALQSAILSSFKFDFSIKLPTRAAKHNATSIEDNGKTLVWSLVMGQGNRMHLEATQWNLRNILNLAIGLLLIIIPTLLLIRRRSEDRDIVVDTSYLD